MHTLRKSGTLGQAIKLARASENIIPNETNTEGMDRGICEVLQLLP